MLHHTCCIEGFHLFICFLLPNHHWVQPPVFNLFHPAVQKCIQVHQTLLELQYDTSLKTLYLVYQFSSLLAALIQHFQNDIIHPWLLSMYAQKSRLTKEIMTAWTYSMSPRQGLRNETTKKKTFKEAERTCKCTCEKRGCLCTTKQLENFLINSSKKLTCCSWCCKSSRLYGPVKGRWFADGAL